MGHFMDVEWSVEGADSSALFYGATMETRTGVVLDNFLHIDLVHILLDRYLSI